LPPDVQRQCACAARFPVPSPPMLQYETHRPRRWNP
jgi:hypothetical protein